VPATGVFLCGSNLPHHPSHIRTRYRNWPKVSNARSSATCVTLPFEARYLICTHSRGIISSGQMGEPLLGGGQPETVIYRSEELPDSRSRTFQVRDEVAPRNSKWGQAGESRVLTTTATERIPTSARWALARGEPVG